MLALLFGPRNDFKLTTPERSARVAAGADDLQEAKVQLAARERGYGLQSVPNAADFSDGSSQCHDFPPQKA
jgi:hypothetical protein